jgi:hypothetical protein
MESKASLRQELKDLRNVCDRLRDQLLDRDDQMQVLELKNRYLRDRLRIVHQDTDRWEDLGRIERLAQDGHLHHMTGMFAFDDEGNLIGTTDEGFGLDGKAGTVTDLPGQD